MPGTLTEVVFHATVVIGFQFILSLQKGKSPIISHGLGLKASVYPEVHHTPKGLWGDWPCINGASFKPAFQGKVNLSLWFRVHSWNITGLGEIYITDDPNKVSSLSWCQRKLSLAGPSLLAHYRWIYEHFRVRRILGIYQFLWIPFKQQMAACM